MSSQFIVGLVLTLMTTIVHAEGGYHTPGSSFSRQLFQPGSSSSLSGKDSSCDLRPGNFNLSTPVPVNTKIYDDIVPAPDVSQGGATVPADNGAGGSSTGSTSGASGPTTSSAGDSSQQGAKTADSSSSGNDASIIAGLKSKNCSGCHGPASFEGSNLADLSIKMGNKTADPAKFKLLLDTKMSGVFTAEEKTLLKKWADLK